MTDRDLERLRRDLTHVGCWLMAGHLGSGLLVAASLDPGLRAGRLEALLVLDEDDAYDVEPEVHEEGLRALHALGYVTGVRSRMFNVEVGRPSRAVPAHERLAALARIDRALRP